MKTVSGNFTTKSSATNRNVKQTTKIDWDLNGTFTDETARAIVVEVERKVNMPLGGINVAIADVTLSNYDDRYTPPGSTI